MRNKRIGIGLGMLLLLPCAASADGAFGSSWDDSHMLSRYRSVLAIESTPPPALGGINRYHSVSHAPEAARHSVPETLTEATNRPWEPGLRRNITPDRQSSFDRSDLVAGRHSGTRGDSRAGSSTLRGGVRSTPSR